MPTQKSAVASRRQCESVIAASFGRAADAAVGVRRG